jgi:hypothetical protein
VSLLDQITDALESLVPPHDADPKKIRGWRWRVALVSCTAFVGLILTDAADRGFMPLIPAFATAQQVQDLAKQQHDFILQLVNDDILGTREKQCHETNDDAKQLYTRELAWLNNEYRHLTGAYYQIPDCADL